MDLRFFTGLALLPALLVGSFSMVQAQTTQPLLKLASAEEITVENDIEYANPDNQHL
jgi:hypothetical protein